MSELALCSQRGCTNWATARVTYFQDDNGSKVACGRHLARACEEVATAANLSGWETLRLTPMNGMADRILRAKHRAARGGR